MPWAGCDLTLGGVMDWKGLIVILVQPAVEFLEVVSSDHVLEFFHRQSWPSSL